MVFTRAEMIDIERVDFVALPTRHLGAARRFYGETLGLRRNPHTRDDYPEFETGSVTLALHVPPADAEFHPSTAVVALRVPDVAAAREKLEAAGVDFDGETIDTGVCHMAFFTDPDGNALLLHRRYAPVGAS